MKTHADKEILKQFKDDIFNENIPTGVTIKKYFKFATSVKTEQTLAYKNSTCESVADSVRTMLKKKEAYEVGEVLVCRKYLKGKFGKCSVNFEYIIKSVRDDSVALKALHGKVPIALGLDVIKNVSFTVTAAPVIASRVHQLIA